ncbi:uncharacterized protein K452DRAFT_127675 [Aplosporella prunicola CBS 121167]|uniref:DNA2/NAM7 helicase-like C-terminal domain-containing protein n=1 Tax=Aplosporella prunicola CBS 121167 TaxID=1176127 RepID=A0A6A6B062_9PEZI|nr:uncharacterized protein K452DRAFT_127675 [Aplosporella prunicola CBS 121167]KAF2136634.1 hypothetical protein K452DRAFT_127675 [Aplosporella prunicola CBS 121167]
MTSLDLRYIPRVLTVDSSQGQEAKLVFFDLVVTEAEKPSDMGFVSEEKRSCVSFTRAKQVLTIVGGSLAGKMNDLKSSKFDDEESEATRSKLVAVLEYKSELLVTDPGRYQRVSAPTRTRPIPSDLTGNASGYYNYTDAAGASSEAVPWDASAPDTEAVGGWDTGESSTTTGEPRASTGTDEEESDISDSDDFQRGDPEDAQDALDADDNY